MSGAKWIGLVVVAVVGISAWSSGAFDKQLVDAGLNSQTCAQNLFGGKMCGDELIRFCKDNYDPQINAETCDDVLRDAGTSAAAILRQRRARARRRAAQARAAARTDGSRNTPISLKTIEYTVKTMTTRRRISMPFDAVVAKSGNVFVLVDITYRNHETKPVDLLCTGGDNFRLADDRERVYSTDSDAMFEATKNDEACSRELQPDEQEDATIIFQVPASVNATELLIGSPSDSPPPDTSPYLAIALT